MLYVFIDPVLGLTMSLYAAIRGYFMTYTVTISGNAVFVEESSINFSDRTNERSTFSCTVMDDNGLAHYYKGQSVILADTSGNVFKGSIDTVDEYKPSNNAPMLKYDVSCTDMHWCADKRIAIKAYVNMYAGDIVADLITSYLAPEGVQAQVAYDRDTTTTDFSAGTLSGVASSTSGDGALQLALAGSNLDVVTTTTSDFSAGTLTNVTAINNALALTNQYGVKVFGKVANTNGNLYFYWKIWSGSVAIVSGYKLVYDIWVPSNNPLARGGVDGSFSDGTTLRDFNSQSIKDQNGIASHPNTDLSGYTDQWYSRVFDLTSLAGKTLNNITVSQEGDSVGSYTFYVKKIFIKDNSNTTIATIFDSSSLNASSQTSNTGYSNISVSVATVYLQTGTRVSPTSSLTGVGLIRSGYSITNSNVPTNTYVNNYTSIDGGATWSSMITGNNNLVGILPGLNVSGKTIQTRQDLGFYGSDPTITPLVNDNTLHVDTAYTATKADYINTWDTQTDFNTGTNTNTSNDATGKVILTGAYRNWDDGVITSQTLSGAGSPTQVGSIVNKVLTLGTTTANDVKSRFDFAGTWATFTVSMDIVTPPASTNLNPGIVYLTTGTWLAADTFAYFAGINNGNVYIRRGTNGGASSSTVIANPSHNIAPNTQVTMRVSVDSSHVHKVYIDDVLYITVTDSTYTAAGYVGARINNGSGVTQTMPFDNFAIVSATTGTWVSASQTISTVGTLDNSLITWDDTVPNGATDLVETSIDNGSTWSTATNGGQVPGLTTAGTSMSGKTLKVRCTLTCSNPNLIPSLNAVSIYIASSYSATGYRISPSLDLTPVSRAGYSNMTFNTTTPTNTSVAIATSIDAGSTWQACTNNAPISSLALQPLPFVDYATSDGSSNYTITGTWLWDGVARNITASTTGGLKYAAYSTYDSAFVEFDTYAADGIGAYINYADVNNMYYALIRDSQSVNASAGNAYIYKVVAGVWTTLATIPIACTREQLHRFRFTKDGTLLTLDYDGVRIITYTDGGTLIAANPAGMYNLDGVGVLGSIRIQPLGTNCVGKGLLYKATLTSTNSGATPLLNDVTVSVKSEKIEPGPIIAETTFNYVNVADCLQSLAEQANKWYTIDANGVLWFKDRYTEPSPFVVTGYNVQSGVRIRSSNPQYRNTEYVVGGKDTTSVQYKTFMGDGNTKNWTMNFPLAKVPTILINGVTKLAGIKAINVGYEYYWSENDLIIYQDDNITTLSKTDKIEIYYQGYFDTVVIVPNPAEILQRQAVESMGTGIVEIVDDAPNIATQSGSYQLANAKLDMYGSIGRTATFRIDKPGLKAGQILTIAVPEHNLINDQFIIESVTVTDEESYLWYDVSATDGPLTNSWARAFAKMAPVTKVDKINLGSGSTVAVPVSASDTTTWSESAVVTVYACPVASTSTLCSTTLYCC